MNTLKNIPLEQGAALHSLIEPRTDRIVSMALSNSDHVQVSLFTFADGEMVSEEAYLGDTFYHLLEGETKITRDGREFVLRAGDIMAVNANVLHTVGCMAAFKMLQVTIND